jgi:hypothetical protein
MKLTLLLLAGLLLLGGSAFAQGPAGTMMITGYGGYTLGFGDAFDDFELLGAEISTSAGICFGGIFHFFINDMFAVGGELYMQSYKGEVKYSSTYGGLLAGTDFSETNTEMNFLFNALYPMSYSEEQAIYLMFGGGLYGDDESEFGAHGGIAWHKALSPNIDLVITPRFHVIFADETVMMVQVTAGAGFGFGK